MRAVWGWFSRSDVVDAAPLLGRMREAGRLAPDDTTVRVLPRAGMGVAGAVARPHLVEADGWMLVVAGHPRLDRAQGATTDAGEILAALRARGKAALASIHGDFALAVWDGQARRGWLAVDRIGAHALVYAAAPDGLVFGSTLDLIAGHPGARRKLSPQALFDYLYFHVSPGPHTVYEGAMRLAPGHCIEFGPDGAAAPQPYWSMRFTEGGERRTEVLKREFVALLHDAVRDAAGDVPVGAFLSGGTDSSTVSGVLGRVGGKPARTFSIGFDVPGFDETSYARITAKHFGCEHHEYYVTPADVVDALPRIAASYDQPFGNASAVPAYYCAKVAREHGVVRLLAGDGGDELFGGNERYAKHYLLGLYQRVPAALRRGLIEPALLSTPGIGAVPGLRKLRSYVEQARPAMPLRYESYNLLQHLGVQEVLTPEFLATVNRAHPRELLVEAHAPFADASLINQMLGIDLRFILADGDLPKVTHMCNLAGVDVAFPLLDDRLVEFSSRVPSDLKLRGTRLRWFFKQALLDFLPPEVIAKQKHGFGLPVGHWLLEHRPLFDLASDSMARLRTRGIVRPEFIDDLAQRRLREHAGYYGTMVWILMMLGLWLDSRGL